MKIQPSYDVVVLGSGIAGLSFANYFLSAQQQKSFDKRLSLLVVSKGDANQTNTSWAQGGIAAPIDDNDSVPLHVQDTLNAGVYENDEYITHKIIAQAPFAIQDLISWGATFDKNEEGEFDLGLEGGHSHPRILHHRDATGANIQFALNNQFSKLGGEVKSNFVAIDIQKKDKGFSILFFDRIQQTVHSVFCSQLIMATGGVGQLFEHTTNTVHSNGDGIFLAEQLHAQIRDLSMIQFHPTGLYSEDGRDFLITEALRGAGAVLLNHNHQPFMNNYDERADLAPRDIVARAIWNEMKVAGKNFVWLDATGIDDHQLTNHFSTIINNCIERVGVDPRTNFIPVMPVQHYSCGGIITNEFGESTVHGLFALGECASTGLHGANRLASNSLLEGICMAKFACERITQQGEFQHHPSISETIALPIVYDVDISVVKSILSDAAGVIRKHAEMTEALEKLEDIKAASTTAQFSLAAFENTVSLNLSILLLKDALSKKKSVGVHYIEA
jgi:L-aspartate oxidase